MPPRLRPALGLVLVLLIAVVYLPVLHNGFVNIDDQGYVTENPHLRGGITAGNVTWAFTATSMANWHPLTWLSHLLDVQLYGLSPGGHHLTSLVLHAAAAVLLLLALIQATGAPWPSLAVAALFALHPLHVEPVAWVAERKDVLAGFFFMLALLAYLRYVRKPSLASLSAVWVLHALALMAKPMAVTFPFVLLILDWWPLGRLYGPRQKTKARCFLSGLLAEKAPLLGLSLASSIVTVIAQQRGGAMQPLAALSFGARVSHALTAYLWYIGKTLLPVRLAVYYPLPANPPPFWEVLVSLLALLGATVLAVVIAPRRPFVPVGWLWYLGMLVPVIGIVQVGGQYAADRYTYLPLIGLFIAFAWTVNGLTGGGRTLAIWGTSAALLVLGAATRVQVLYWRDSVTLHSRAIRVTDGNWMAWHGLGNAYLAQNRTQEALAAYTQTVLVRPEYAAGHNSLGLALDALGRESEAAAAYRRALALRPELAEARNNLGAFENRAGRLAEAEEQFRLAIRYQPQLKDSYFNLGSILMSSGRDDEAQTVLAQGLVLDPGNAAGHNNLAVILYQKGDVSGARSHLEEALRLRPGYEQARRNLEMIGSRGGASPTPGPSVRPPSGPVARPGTASD